ncbi:WcbI family polysaccharide biosynthesis putative acetyltransferase [Gephyromycinifex aptenodytis]|uniref:WcbI family polysaccharide biosynthesis putative acetyltransferase n=1 Tax=Gephyromycinifex aptenodytis TaxID=2716227 RepID=UPI001445C331|nr:WcbI family polysaccharide biosynthesis putative acetyltransferase [Gephyromycinifex aptenodytis]
MPSPPAPPLRDDQPGPTPPPPPATASAGEPDGRTLHYGTFYGIHEIPQDERPLVLVWGNCQAEALRLLLTDSPSAAVRTVRMPPVHEIEAEDLPHLARLLERADVLLAQPVAHNYRGLPLGTAQVASGLPQRARVLRWPVLFFAGLYPYQVLVRQPDLGDPPLVPYHDLRTIIQAEAGRPAATRLDPQAFSQACAALVQESRESLAQREQAHETLVVSDVLNTLSVDLCHTINHPGNTWLLETARRVQHALGLPEDAEDPGRVLLSSILTPLEEPVLQALGLDVDPRPQWHCGGAVLQPQQVHAAQLEFYRQHPGFVQEGLQRHARTIKALGLA